MNSISTKLSTRPTQQEDGQQSTNEQSNSLQRYRVQVHRNGQMSRLPENYEYPKGGASDLWMKWNIGDAEQNIPPLRILKAADFRFMDSKQKTQQELMFQRGKHKANRRPAKKTFADMKFLCTYIETKAREGNMDSNDRSAANVHRMYEAAEQALFLGSNNDRNTQLKWTTLVHRLRTRISKQNKQQQQEQQQQQQQQQQGNS